MTTQLEEPRIRKAAYSVAACPRCGSEIEKGTLIELWEDPTRFGKGRIRWAHSNEECRAAAAARETGGGAGGGCSLEQVREEVKTQLAEAIGGLDLSGLDDAMKTAAEQHLKGVVSDVDKRLDEFASKMGEAHAESAGEIAKSTSEALTSAVKGMQSAILETITKVEQMIADGVPKVYEFRLPGKDPKKGNKGEHFHPVFEEVMDLCLMGRNVFLPGPAGCGKTKLASQIAERLERPFRFISCSAGMSEGQLNGRLAPQAASREALMNEYQYFVSQGIEPVAAAQLAASAVSGFNFIISEFVRAYEEGSVFLLDECDASDSNTLLVLQAALAGSKMAVPNRPGKPYADRHPDFVCIAAANTYGRGADRLYVGRAQLDEAFNDRFRIGVVPMDYDQKLELWFANQLSEDKQYEGKKALNEIWRIREAAGRNRLQRVVSTRFIEQAMSAIAFGKDADYVKAKLVTGWAKDELTKVGM